MNVDVKLSEFGDSMIRAASEHCSSPDEAKDFLEFMIKNVILECKNVTKSYKEARHDLTVLKEINFKITKGEQVAIMGRSGSGKTTLLQLLGGLDAPCSGDINFLGKNWFKISDRKRCDLRNKGMGFIYQLHHLLPEFTALENVAMPLLLRTNSIKEIQYSNQ